MVETPNRVGNGQLGLLPHSLALVVSGGIYVHFPLAPPHKTTARSSGSRPVTSSRVQSSVDGYSPRFAEAPQVATPSPRITTRVASAVSAAAKPLNPPNTFFPKITNLTDSDTVDVLGPVTPPRLFVARPQRRCKSDIATFPQIFILRGMIKVGGSPSNLSSYFHSDPVGRLAVARHSIYSTKWVLAYSAIPFRPDQERATVTVSSGLKPNFRQISSVYQPIIRLSTKAATSTRPNSNCNCPERAMAWL
jgi:hypothetical protein